MTHKKLEEIFFKEHHHGKLDGHTDIEEKVQILYTEEGVKTIVKEILSEHIVHLTGWRRHDVLESIAEVDKMWKNKS